MTERNTNAKATGTHAPSKNLITEAEKKRASMEPKKRTNPIASRTFLCQQITITSDIKQEVTSITETTAKPVAHSTLS